MTLAEWVVAQLERRQPGAALSLIEIADLMDMRPDKVSKGLARAERDGKLVRTTVPRASVPGASLNGPAKLLAWRLK